MELGTGYVVDVVGDGVQHFDSGIILSEDLANTAFDLIVTGEMPSMPELPNNYTIRLIRNGEVIRKDEVSRNTKGPNMATITLASVTANDALSDARAHLSDTLDNVSDYLATEGADLASDAYIDLRRAARNSQDRVDAAELAVRNAGRDAARAWADARPGDVLHTRYGTGTLKARGSVAGWMIAADGVELRVELRDVISITRA